MIKQLNHVIYTLFITLIGMQIGTANAFEGDSDLPARVESESMEIDFKTGSRILIGNVSLLQGSFELFADKVIAEYNGDVLQRATAFGNPAVVNDQPDADTKVNGSAARIELDRTTDDIILTGNAKLFQDTTDSKGNPMKLNTNGERITYNLGKETLKVVGGNTSTKSVGGQAPPPAKPKPAAANPQAAAPTTTDTPTAAATPTATPTAAPSATEAPASAPESGSAEAQPELTAEDVPRSGGRTRLVILPKGGVNRKMQKCGEGDEDSPDFIDCGELEDE